MTFTKDSTDLIIEFKNRIYSEIRHTNDMIESIKKHFPENKTDINNLNEYMTYLNMIHNTKE